MKQQCEQDTFKSALIKKKIIILSLCLSGCASIQDDIKIVDEVLQAEEKIYDEHTKEK